MNLILLSIILFCGGINGKRPEDRCNAVGDRVCYSCNSVGICKEDPENPEEFFVEVNETCLDGSVCDSDIEDGSCFPFPPEFQCYCQDGDQCKIDPNNEDVTMICDSDCSDPSQPGMCTCLSSFPNLSTIPISSSKSSIFSPETSTSLFQASTFFSQASTSLSEASASFSEALTSPSEGSDSTISSITTSEINFTNLTATIITSPQDRCQENEQHVCLSCNSVGSCIELADGSFVVIAQETCTDSELCDSDIKDGYCLSITPSTSNCFCRGECQVDINNPLALFLCKTGETILCSEAVDISTCECTTLSGTMPIPSTKQTTTIATTVTTNAGETCPPCGFVDFSDSDCSRYFYCGGGGLVLGNCPGSTCFNPNSCTCS